MINSENSINKSNVDNKMHCQITCKRRGRNNLITRSIFSVALLYLLF